MRMAKLMASLSRRRPPRAACPAGRRVPVAMQQLDAAINKAILRRTVKHVARIGRRGTQQLGVENSAVGEGVEHEFRAKVIALVVIDLAHPCGSNRSTAAERRDLGPEAD